MFELEIHNDKTPNLDGCFNFHMWLLIDLNSHEFVLNHLK
jgi:hypothetical protein